MKELKQKRSAETLQKILDTGTRLFSENGYYATSSKTIAKAAGISVGSFYNYFSNKKELLFEIHRIHAEKIHAMVETSLQAAYSDDQPVDGNSVTRKILEHALEMHSFSPKLHAQITALIYTDPDFEKMGAQEEERSAAVLAKVLQAVPVEVRVKDLDAATRVIVKTIESVVHSIKIFGATIEENRLIDALADMIHRYLFDDGE